MACKQPVELFKRLSLDTALTCNVTEAAAGLLGHCECLFAAGCVLANKPLVGVAVTVQPAQQAVEQRHVGARPNGQVQFCIVAGGCAAWIDHDNLQGFGPRACRQHALVQHGMAPCGVRADQNQQACVIDVCIGHRHDIFTKCAFVSGDCGGHAQPRVGIDVRAAKVALHELVGDVVVLCEQLPRDIQGNCIGTMGCNDLLQSVCDFIQGARPCHGYVPRDCAQLRPQQASLQAECFAKRTAFDAETPEICRVCWVADDMCGLIAGRRACRQARRRASPGSQHTAADTAVGTGCADRSHGNQAACRPNSRFARGPASGLRACSCSRYQAASLMSPHSRTPVKRSPRSCKCR